MKVFQLNECDWYMAPTLDEAIEMSTRDSGLPRDEAADDDARECTPEEMGRLKFRDDDDTVRTFQEELDRRIAAGARTEMFASTECESVFRLSRRSGSARVFS